MARWQLRKPKQQFSRLVERARRPRSHHGDFKRFLTTGPRFDGLEVERSTDLPREIEF